jgi:hypothetical protein
VIAETALTLAGAAVLGLFAYALILEVGTAIRDRVRLEPGIMVFAVSVVVVVGAAVSSLVI